MPIGLGRPNAPNFRAGYLRSALGAVDRRRDLQRSIDGLLNGEQDIIDLVRLRELISVGIGEVPAECRETVWALLLGVLPTARPLWSFVTKQLNDRYMDLSEAADVLITTQKTGYHRSTDRIRRVLQVANQLERVGNLIPVHGGIMKVFASVFPDAEAFAFFMYCSFMRSAYQSFMNLSELVFGVCEVIGVEFRKVLDRRKTELSQVLQLWIDSCFISAKLLGSLLPIWERIVLLQSSQFIISVCLALLSCARESIMQSSDEMMSISAITQAAIRDRPVELIFSKALELDATLSRKMSRDLSKKQNPESKSTLR